MKNVKWAAWLMAEIIGLPFIWVFGFIVEGAKEVKWQGFSSVRNAWRNRPKLEGK
jgi:hypothetical protein